MNYKTAPFHTLLSSVGKKTLRPGGLEATNKCLDFLDLSSYKEDDKLIEIACNKGLSCIRNAKLFPRLHIDATDIDEGVVKIARENIERQGFEKRVKVFEDDITASKLGQNYKGLLNEAMLAMLPMDLKARALGSFFKLVKKGGKIAIHDLLINYEDEEAVKKLRAKIRVDAHPITLKSYKELFSPFKEKINFIAFEVGTFNLLKINKVIFDEGIIGSLNILKNLLLKDKELLKRVLENKAFFKKHEDLFAHVVILIELNP